MSSEKYDELLQEFLLENHLASEEELKKSFKIREKARDFGGSLTILEILFHMGSFSRSELEKIMNRIPEQIPKLTDKLPPEAFLLVQNLENLEERALEENIIRQNHQVVCHKLQNKYEKLGISRSTGEILVEMRFIGPEEIKTLFPAARTSQSQTSPEEDSPSSKINLNTDSLSEEAFSSSPSEKSRGQRESYKTLPLIAFAFLGSIALLIFTWSLDYSEQTSPSPEALDEKPLTSSDTQSASSNEDEDQNEAPKNKTPNTDGEEEDNQSPPSRSFTLTKSLFLPDKLSHPLRLECTLSHLDSAQNMASIEVKTNKNGKGLLNFGPFRKHASTSRLPPGFYIVQGSFKSFPSFLPTTTRYAAETHLPPDESLQILESGNWNVPLIIKHGSNQQIMQFHRGSLQFLLDKSSDLKSLIENWQEKFNAEILEDNPGGDKEKLLKKLLSALQNEIKSLQNTVDRKYSRYIEHPYSEKKNQFSALTDQVYYVALRSAKSAVEKSKLSSPEYLIQEINKVSNSVEGVNLTSKNEFYEEVRHYREELNKMITEDNPSKKLQNHLNQEIEAMNNILPFLKPLLTNEEFRTQAFHQNKDSLKKQLMQVTHFVESYILIKKNLFYDSIIRKNVSNHRQYQNYFEKLLSFARATLIEVIQSFLDNPQSFIETLFPSPLPQSDASTLLKDLTSLQDEFDAPDDS